MLPSPFTSELSKFELRFSINSDTVILEYPSAIVEVEINDNKVKNTHLVPSNVEQSEVTKIVANGKSKGLVIKEGKIKKLERDIDENNLYSVLKTGQLEVGDYEGSITVNYFGEEEEKKTVKF